MMLGRFCCRNANKQANRLIGAAVRRRGGSGCCRLAFSSTTTTTTTTTTNALQSPSVYMWGSDDNNTKIPNNKERGALVVPTKVDITELTSSSRIMTRQVICGPTDTAFLLDDGTCWVMGDNKHGQLGVGHTKPVTRLQQVQLPNEEENHKIQYVSLGMNFSAFVDDMGDLYTCGFGGSAFSGGMGCLGHGNSDSVLTPKRVQSLVEDGCLVKQVAASESHMTVLTTEGEVLTTGAGSYGRLGNYDTSTDQLYLEPVEMLTPADHVVAISGGKSFSLALTKDGIIYSWGRNHKGQLGTGLGLSVDIYAMQAVPEPIQADELLNRKIIQVSAGHSHAACVSDKGEVFYWGMARHFDPVPVRELLHTKIVSVSCGENYTLALDQNGHLYSWGNSKSSFRKTTGVLGQGSNVALSHTAAPVYTTLDPKQKQRVTQISAGWKHAACLVEQQQQREEEPQTQ